MKARTSEIDQGIFLTFQKFNNYIVTFQKRRYCTKWKKNNDDGTLLVVDV